jgi:hypothetical protein
MEEWCWSTPERKVLLLLSVWKPQASSGFKTSLQPWWVPSSSTAALTQHLLGKKISIPIRTNYVIKLLKLYKTHFQGKWMTWFQSCGREIPAGQFYLLGNRILKALMKSLPISS